MVLKLELKRYLDLASTTYLDRMKISSSLKAPTFLLVNSFQTLPSQ